MSLETRLKKLEATRPATRDGVCDCLITETRVYYPGNEPPSRMPLTQTCEACGGERRVRKIEVICPREEVTTAL
jgi:hypothetical protein